MTTTDRPASRRTPIARRLLAPLALLSLGACAQIEGVRVAGYGFGLFDETTRPQTERLSAPLGPIARPKAPLAGRFSATNLLTGKTLSFETRRAGDGVRVRQSDGCVWTRTGDWFTPSDSWANCDDSAHWSAGRAKVRALDSIWPLEPGAEGRWGRDAVSHTGRSYTRETTCRVVGSEAVIRAGRAPTPAHVVVCADGKRTRTTWFAPGEGPVAFRKTHADKGVEEAWVRF